MSASIYIMGQFQLRGSRPSPEIECDDDGCLWIRHGNDTVALKLTDSQFAELELAIAAARTHDLPMQEGA